MRKINDHSVDLGDGKKSVFPTEVKVKEYHADGGEGHILDYPDTIEKIDRDQAESERQMKAKKTKPGYRQ